MFCHSAVPSLPVCHGCCLHPVLTCSLSGSHGHAAYLRASRFFLLSFSTGHGKESNLKGVHLSEEVEVITIDCKGGHTLTPLVYFLKNDFEAQRGVSGRHHLGSV